MKKVCLLLVVVLFITGCSNNRKLNCTGSVNMFDTKVEVVYNTKKMNIKSAKGVYALDLSEYTDEQVEKLRKSDMCDSLKNYPIEKCKVEFKDERMILKANFKADVMNENDFSGEKVTFDVVKQKFEKEIAGKCKEDK